VLWIRIAGFISFIFLAFYLNADPDVDPDPGSKTNEDPGGSRSGQTFKSQKVEFLHEKYT
jgi:hypothetical protein